jgi:hypothetical protein
MFTLIAYGVESALSSLATDEGRSPLPRLARCDRSSAWCRQAGSWVWAERGQIKQQGRTTRSLSASWRGVTGVLRRFFRIGVGRRVAMQRHLCRLLPPLQVQASTVSVLLVVRTVLVAPFLWQDRLVPMPYLDGHLLMWESPAREAPWLSCFAVGVVTHRERITSREETTVRGINLSSVIRNTVSCISQPWWSVTTNCRAPKTRTPIRDTPQVHLSVVTALCDIWLPCHCVSFVEVAMARASEVWQAELWIGKVVFILWLI